MMPSIVVRPLRGNPCDAQTVGYRAERMVLAPSWLALAGLGQILAHEMQGLAIEPQLDICNEMKSSQLILRVVDTEDGIHIHEDGAF